MRAVRGAWLALLVLTPTAAEARPLRVLSLDQCADQYVLALAPEAELALSSRADDPDSWMRQAARGRPKVRPTLEAAVGFRPDVVVRYWGGEPRLLAALEKRGTRVLNIDDATDMDGVRENLRAVSQGLGQEARGEALAAHMDRRLAQAAGAGRGREVVYVTPGGYTSGAGSLIDAVLRAAGFRNGVTAPGYQPLGIEKIALSPPALFVRGFFQQWRADWRGAGRHPVVQRAARGRTAADLPASALGCPAWFAADAAAQLAEAGR
ncbi:MAG: ABC transporter substrate-binding protein [Candidatus Brevundimonas phytovorans]|nr:ABC transporter substrate-binding protein [Brevundimonas sp.]WEK59284.1 MAG: ABC transporter substrate-binding protein [Brevundimonas sp.]